MKLLLITAIEEFQKEVKSILKISGVKSFSYESVKGFKNEKTSQLDNWFSNDHIGVNSVLFTVFVEMGFVDEIYKNVEKFNSEQESLSHIHVATINVERSI